MDAEFVCGFPERDVALDDGRTGCIGARKTVGGIRFPGDGRGAQEAQRGGCASRGRHDGAKAVLSGRETEIQRNPLVSPFQRDGSLVAPEIYFVVRPKFVLEDGKTVEESMRPLLVGGVCPTAFHAAGSPGGLQG